ncbi:MAG: hypothetical protein ACYDCO_19660 [Armatimonadota bacterium]
MGAGDIVRGELRSVGRLFWAIEVGLLIMAVLWLLVSVLRYYNTPGGGAARWADASGPVAQVALLAGSERHVASAAVVVLAEKHPLLASIVDDIANPCLAHIVVLLLTPLLVVVVWHWDDFWLREQERKS